MTVSAAILFIFVIYHIHTGSNEWLNLVFFKLSRFKWLMHNFKSKGFGVKQREPCTRAAKNMYGLWVSWHWHEFLYLYETVYISRDGPYLPGILEGKQVHDAIMKLMPIWPGHIDWTNMNEPANWHGFWGHGKPKHPKSSKYPSARGKIKGVGYFTNENSAIFGFSWLNI